MKYLTNKKLWAAIIGLITALGTLMVTLDEAKADAGTPGYVVEHTAYAADCSSNPEYAGKVDSGRYTIEGLSFFTWRYAFLTTGTSKNLEVYVVIKYDENNPRTWKYWSPKDGRLVNNNYTLLPAYMLNSTATPAFSGYMKKNTTFHCLQLVESKYLQSDYPDQVCILYDTILNKKLDSACVTVATIPGNYLWLK